MTFDAASARARATTDPPGRLRLADEFLIDAEEGGAGPADPTSSTGAVWLCVGLVAVAFNLRPVLSSLAPVLPAVSRDLGITPAFAGVLTTAPVVCLALFGPLAPGLARRVGAETAVLASLIVLAAGLGLRGLASPAALLVGSLLAGAGLGVIGVLLPGIVKREFPARAGLMTGVYTMVMCTGAAAGAGLTVPLAGWLGLGWLGALAAWALPAAVAALLWLPQVRPRRGGASATVSEVRGLWRDRLAWAVTLFMGFQASLAYIVFAWLPVALQDRGLDPLSAGVTASASLLAQAPAALLVATAAARVRDQRLLAIGVLAAAAAGWTGMLFGPPAAIWPAAVVLGLGLGGCFGLALTLIVLRSRDSHVATHLSGMVQSVGYLVAALGPVGIGVAHQWSGEWGRPTALYVLLAACAAVFALPAGRDRTVLPGET